MSNLRTRVAKLEVRMAEIEEELRPTPSEECRSRLRKRFFRALDPSQLEAVTHRDGAGDRRT